MPPLWRTLWRTLCCGALIAFCDRPLAAEDVLSSAEAANRLGEQVVVELTIRSGGQNGEYQELYSAMDWKEEDCFILRFSSAARDAFATAEVTNLLDHYLNETVRVTGEVQHLRLGAKTKPVIYVEDADAIELVSTDSDYLPKDKYALQKMAGFNVFVSPVVLSHGPMAARALRIVEKELEALNTSLPKDKLEVLRHVSIWIEWELREDGAAEFHPSKAWLRRNGRNPEKAGSVEVSNLRNYVNWNREKRVSGMLHEMSHAFHNLQLGFDHAGIDAAYEQAMQRRLYDSVRTANGATAPSYATTNAKEYFAEITESYFGRNDFYPFNRSQLKSHDPVGYRLVRELWLQPLPNTDQRNRPSRVDAE